MKSIKYIKGDATRPVGEGHKIIIHCCNDIGGWGSGFVISLSQRWRLPEEKYRAWCRGMTHAEKPFALGSVQFVEVSPDITVANIIGQHGIGWSEGVPPIRYEAMDSGLTMVAEFAIKHGASVHGPRLGCDRAGGSWEKVARMLIDRLCAKDIDVTIYTL